MGMTGQPTLSPERRRSAARFWSRMPVAHGIRHPHGASHAQEQSEPWRRLCFVEGEDPSVPTEDVVGFWNNSAGPRVAENQPRRSGLSGDCAWCPDREADWAGGWSVRAEREARTRGLAIGSLSDFTRFGGST